MADPAFEEHHVTGAGGVGDEGLVMGPMFGSAGWGGHELAETRVFEFEGGASGGGFDVVGSADGGEGVEMEAVNGVLGHDVDPAIGHGEFAAFEVEVQMIGEAEHVTGEVTLEFHEGGGEAMEPAHGGVGGEAIGIVLGGPASAGVVMVANLVGFLEQFRVQASRGGAGAEQGGPIEEGGEPGLDVHAVRVGGRLGAGQTEVRGCGRVGLAGSVRKNFG